MIQIGPKTFVQRNLILTFEKFCQAVDGTYAEKYVIVNFLQFPDHQTFTEEPRSTLSWVKLFLFSAELPSIKI